MKIAPYRYPLSREPLYDACVVVDDCETGKVLDKWFLPSWSPELLPYYDPENAYRGNYGLTFKKTGESMGSGLGLLPRKPMSFAGMNALRMWVRPDGSNQLVAIGFRDGGGEVFWTEFDDMLAGTEPYILQVPLADFKYVALRNNSFMDMNCMQEFIFWLLGNYHFSIDELMFVHDPAVAEFDPFTTTYPAVENEIYQINCGGGEAALFNGDNFFDRGSIAVSYVQSAQPTVALEPHRSPVPPALYRSHRFGSDAIAYEFPNCVPGLEYTVRLHFCEIYDLTAGQRVQSISINGAPVYDALDIVAETGAPNIALVKESKALADSEGKIRIEFKNKIGGAYVNGIEINRPRVAVRLGPDWQLRAAIR